MHTKNSFRSAHPCCLPAGTAHLFNITNKNTHVLSIPMFNFPSTSPNCTLQLCITSKQNKHITTNVTKKFIAGQNSLTNVHIRMESASTTHLTRLEAWVPS